MEEIENEQLLTTSYKNSTIRMNIFPKPLSAQTYNNPYQYTANCVPVIKANQIGQTGIVHIIEKVLTPVTKSIFDIINERPDMTILKSILEKTNLLDMIKSEKTLSIFAPTDEAFEKLEPHLRKSLKEGNGCALSKCFFKLLYNFLNRKKYVSYI